MSRNGVANKALVKHSGSIERYFYLPLPLHNLYPLTMEQPALENFLPNSSKQMHTWINTPTSIILLLFLVAWVQPLRLANSRFLRHPDGIK